MLRVRRRSSGLVAATLVVVAWYGISHAPPGLFGATDASASTTFVTPADVLAAEKAVYGTGPELECDRELVHDESSDKVDATNPSSRAYGLPQSLPAEKMASAGPDWRTNPVTQLTWQKDYVDGRYGGVCQALALWKIRNPHWY